MIQAAVDMIMIPVVQYQHTHTHHHTYPQAFSADLVSVSVDSRVLMIN